MNSRIALDAFTRWMTSVAECTIAWIDRVRSPRRVRLIEENAGCFRLEAGPALEAGNNRILLCDGEAVEPLPGNLATALKGGHVELALTSDRFLFRRLDLPARAAEFLDGIVRAQIDRLTPWVAGDAAFGWTPPREIAKDRISVTIGATARSLVMPYVDALTRLGAKMIVATTIVSGSELRDTSIKVLEHRAREIVGVQRIRRGLSAVLVAAAMSAATAVIAAQWIGSDLDDQQTELSRRISQRRHALHGGAAGAAPAQQLLERRKQQVAASVMVIEALSRILPDHTYVTELRMEGDKLQIVGMTRDAPSLIRLMEQSPHFTRATFFAATTRAPGESGERFHIEARLKPVFTRT